MNWHRVLKWVGVALAGVVILAAAGFLAFVPFAKEPGYEFVASWGSGRPVIALGSDIDGIPKSSQKPGVAYQDPIVDGAPGHGDAVRASRTGARA